jgi:hypothetical protein
MDDLFKQAMSLSLFGKCVAAILGMLLIHAGFRVLEQTLPRRFGRADSRYKVRKFVVFSGYITILLFLALLWIAWAGSASPSVWSAQALR